MDRGRGLLLLCGTSDVLFWIAVAQSPSIALVAADAPEAALCRATCQAWIPVSPLALSFGFNNVAALL